MRVFLLWFSLSAALADDEQRNPHTEIIADSGADEVCTLCHAGAPTGEDPALQLPMDRICRSCHLGESHTGVATHVDQTPTTAVRAKAESAGLPLPGGKVVCATCHDPHPTSAAAPHDLIVPLRWWTTVLGHTGDPPPPANTLLRLPLRENALCSACHDPRAPEIEVVP